jgi:oxygen-independent coproporphyrinogen-3 oxidase
VDRVVSALCKEAELRKDETHEIIETIYFGGGTPGILSIDQLEMVINSLHENFKIHKKAEVTLETNPDDVKMGKVLGWKRLGINRLSIGIQSFREEDLRWMNRAHTAVEASQCIKLAQKSGIDNLTVDLIYGLPNLPLSDWKVNLQKALELGVDHISAYCLTVESQTALGHAVAKGKEKPIDEAAAAEQFEYMVEFLERRGVQQYEVSNFAKPGHESKHNSAYWNGTPYVAIGPSAHGFDGQNRYWNVANNARYCQSLEKGELAATIEELTAEDRFNEWIMTGLRTTWGVDLGEAKNRFNVDLMASFKREIEEIIRDGRAVIEANRLKLTKKGLFLADGIASDFFILKHEN